MVHAHEYNTTHYEVLATTCIVSLYHSMMASNIQSNLISKCQSPSLTHYVNAKPILQLTFDSKLQVSVNFIKIFADSFQLADINLIIIINNPEYKILSLYEDNDNNILKMIQICYNVLTMLCRTTFAFYQTIVMQVTSQFNEDYLTLVQLCICIPQSTTPQLPEHE